MCGCLRRGWSSVVVRDTLELTMPGQLFTEYFLTDGIKQTAEWQETVQHPDVLQGLRDAVANKFEKIDLFDKPQEAETEQELILPVLEILGWGDHLPQQSATGGEDVPDNLLFRDEAAKNQAAGESSASAKFRHATVVQESKRHGLALDERESTGGAGRGRTPHGQILRYLSSADVETDGKIRWGILTNGVVWRLYDHRTRPRSTAYYEANLEKILGAENEDKLRIFYLLFNRNSFVLRDGATATFLETAFKEGRRYEEAVAQDLSGIVFDKVFPLLVAALAKGSSEDLAGVHRAALILLYRILFVLYAEDRELLPIRDRRYATYSMRVLLRDDIREKMVEGVTFSSNATKYYDSLATLFRIIDQGDDSIGLPPYNGGLFSDGAAPMLNQMRLDDSTIAPIIYTLSHTNGDDGLPRFINYRDMSVQQLGSIYERLLERQPTEDANGEISIRPNPYARKDSGSFFTPQELVDLIVDHTIDPLVKERLEAFERRAEELASDKRSKKQRQVELQKFDPAEAVLDLKVLDPAMGSGHFLVTAVDFLSDKIADLIEQVPTVPEWLDGEDEYASPLVGRVENIRTEIKERAGKNGWRIADNQLTDQAIVRRMVLKRCIYGVDKNSLTVELAKVSLWLHSFTVGAPLSFLDHHLRSGDSLVGLRVTDMVSELQRLGGVFASSAVQSAQSATDGMMQIEAISDADISEVEESASLFEGVENATANLRSVLDCVCGVRWMTAGMKVREKTAFEAPIRQTLVDFSQDSYKLLAEGPDAFKSDGRVKGSKSWSEFIDVWNEANAIAGEEGFLHWEVAFPGVWEGWQDINPSGGFDAIIGNPPWDRIKLQEVEWFATREPEIALQQTAAARRAAIGELRQNDSDLADEFELAKERADQLGKVIRSWGDYPLLGRGDINLYSLFVERARSLVKPHGLVGLLTPSGIYGDKTAADFFKQISTRGHVYGLFDFENRKIFFKDVHASFKFCALIFGGSERLLGETKCAFFLHDTAEINDSDRCFSLSRDDFARVNPNTGNAPVFRTRKDAQITRDIYERHPVFVDRSGSEENRVWPVKYVRMIDMTNDSGLFRTSEQLQSDGSYKVSGHQWKRGAEVFVPLYEGKMVQAYDHRAASVVVNPENLNRPAMPLEATDEQHADPNWLPDPQFWVSAVDIKWPDEVACAVGIKHVTAVTNIRTMIASLVPLGGFGNSIPIFLPINEDDESTGKEWSYLFAANLNAIALDFVTRQKVQGQNLNLFILEQLPFIASSNYNRQFGAKTAREIIQDHVLRLTYTSHDMEPFARDLGYNGSPFKWDPEERRHLRARLDALYFHLYGISNDDAEYILSTFPIVRREDETEFGRYRTSEMIISYMNALAAGDTEVVVAA